MSQDPGTTKRRYACPACLSGDGLWEAVVVSGWRSINTLLEPAGDRDVDWFDVELDFTARPEVGCSCGWEGSRIEFVQIGIDGKPLPTVHPSQMKIVDE